VLSGGGDVTKITNFRQLFTLDGGLEIEGKKVTYDDFMNAQVDAVVGPADQTSNMNSAQVLGEMGYEIGGSCDEVKERENNPSFDCSKWIKATNSSGTPVVTLTKEQQKAARNRVRLEMEAHLDNETKITAGKAGQQISSQNQGRADEIRNTKSYIGDLNTVLTGDLAAAETTLKGMIETKNKQNLAQNPPLPTITDFDLTDDKIVFYMSDGTPITRDRSIYAETDVNQDGVVDSRDLTSQTGVGQDIAGIFDLLVPGGEGIKTGMADTEILSFIKNQGVILGERGTDRALSYRGEDKVPAKRTSKTKLSAAPGAESMLEVFEGSNSNISKVVDWHDSDDGLRKDLERTFTDFFSGADEKRFSDANFENIQFINEKGSNRQLISFIDKNEEPPKEVIIEIGSDISENSTKSGEITTALANAINEINSMAYDKVKGGKRGTKLNYTQWSAANKQGEEETFAEYMARFNKQFQK